MIEITNAQRLETFRGAPEHIGLLYSSLETSKEIKRIMELFSITDDTFVDLVGDIILNLVSEADCTMYLKEQFHLPPETVTKVFFELGFLFKKKVKFTGQIPDANNDLKEKLELRPDGVPSGAKVTPQPLTREEVLHALAPKRTMASDIESLKQKETGGYTSTTATLKESHEGE